MSCRPNACRPSPPLGEGDRARLPGASRARLSVELVACTVPISTRRRPGPQPRPVRAGGRRACRRLREASAIVVAGRNARLLGARVATSVRPAPSPRERADDRALHRRRPGRARPDHGARARPDRALPGLPVRRLAGAPGDCWRIARRARASSTRRRCRSTRSSREFERATRRARTWRACTRAISRCGAPSASSCGGCASAGIAYTITPGVPSFAAAAAALGQELTLPEVAQSVVLTRTSGRASAMPPSRDAGGLRRDRARRSRSTCPSTRSTTS